jgi:alcohol dehydrogenase class IV
MGVGIVSMDLMDAAQIGAEKVKNLIKMLEVPTLSELGVTGAKLEPVVEKMAEDAIVSGSPGNNPRQPSKEDIIELYRAAL